MGWIALDIAKPHEYLSISKSIGPPNREFRNYNKYYKC